MEGLHKGWAIPAATRHRFKTVSRGGTAAGGARAGVLGMTCYQFLGMPLPKGPVAKFAYPGDAADQPHQIITLTEESIDRGDHTMVKPDKVAPVTPYSSSGSSSLLIL